MRCVEITTTRGWQALLPTNCEHDGVLIDLEARKDGGCADTEREDVGDRGDGDCDSGVLIGRRLNNISCSCVKL